MPYHKDKQQAFQAAQQGMKDVEGAYHNLVKEDTSYGHQLKHLKEEINEAYQQIENAMEVASDTQLQQLTQYRNDLQQIISEVNE